MHESAKQELKEAEAQVARRLTLKELADKRLEIMEQMEVLDVRFSAVAEEIKSRRSV